VHGFLSIIFANFSEISLTLSFRRVLITRNNFLQEFIFSVLVHKIADFNSSLKDLRNIYYLKIWKKFKIKFLLEQ